MIDEKKRKQASTAGKASGERRSTKNRPRDQNIVLAYIYLCGGRQSSRHNKTAKDFLDKHGATFNDEIDPRQVCQMLADCIGRTPRRIQQILKENGADLSLIDRIDREEINVVATVASRLKEARKLNGYTRQQAADRLGMSAFELGRYEDGFDIDHIPLSIIKKASGVYYVSVDFLFGILDEHEDESEEALETRHIMAAIERMSLQEYEHIGKKISKQAITANEVQKLVTAILDIKAAASRFRELNPGADSNMRGGDNVLNRINEALTAAQKVTSGLVRAKLLPLESLRAFRGSK